MGILDGINIPLQGGCLAEGARLFYVKVKDRNCFKHSIFGGVFATLFGINVLAKVETTFCVKFCFWLTANFVSGCLKWFECFGVSSAAALFSLGVSGAFCSSFFLFVERESFSQCDS